ncbi:MAG: hypothetical protein Q4Q18_01440 [Methanobrevibacter sp.]|nr:hypothetical protein [Methanobrevibacter sp.]
MTCIITIFTPDKTIISEDSAVSSNTRTYTGVEKTIILSNDPPMTMSYYGNSDFDNIPVENIISEYVKHTDFKIVNTVDKVKKDFLNYVNKVMPQESIDEYLQRKLISFKEECRGFSDTDMKYYSLINFEKTTLPLFEDYEFDFSDLIPDNITSNEKVRLNRNLNNIFLSLFSDELCGIVIVGVNKKTMKNGYTNFEMLFNLKNNVLICNENEELHMNKSRIKVFAQNDVINGFFNDIDGELLSIISQNLQEYINETLKILFSNLEYKTNISKEDLRKINDEINHVQENSMIKEEFENSIKNLENNNMENILNEIEIMPKCEIMKMNETLINLTRLKRIITSEPMTVDGNVSHHVLSLKNGIEKFY